jgi:trimethylamine:corrinoid methyltransferase-like protein
MPELISRKGYDAWLAEGGQTMQQRARAKLLKIMENHQPQPLTPETLQELNTVLDGAGSECNTS